MFDQEQSFQKGMFVQDTLPLFEEIFKKYHKANTSLVPLESVFLEPWQQMGSTRKVCFLLPLRLRLQLDEPAGGAASVEFLEPSNHCRDAFDGSDEDICGENGNDGKGDDDAWVSEQSMDMPGHDG